MTVVVIIGPVYVEAFLYPSINNEQQRSAVDLKRIGVQMPQSVRATLQVYML
jgi:hypothetical protein